MVGGVCGGGDVWQGMCMVGGIHGRGGGMCGEGHAWLGSGGGMSGRGDACMQETATEADGTHPTGMHSC